MPLHWRKPRVVFVADKSDLFHPKVPNEYIAAVYGVMAACPQHRFLLLTKRPKRMVEWYGWAEKHGSGYDLCRDGMPDALLTCAWEATEHLPEETLPKAKLFGTTWPLPHVWPGCSAEDQDAYDARSPHLYNVPVHPSAGRWISYEPAIGPLDLRIETDIQRVWDGNPNTTVPRIHRAEQRREALSWVVVGTESQKGRRPMPRPWADAVMSQCQRAGVPLFTKQLPECLDGYGRILKSEELAELGWPVEKPEGLCLK
jgi:protein gp37